MSKGRNSTTICIRISDEVLEKLANLADKKRMTIGDYLKARITEHANRSVITTNVPTSKLDADGRVIPWD